MENLTVIVPIHKYNEDVKKYLDKAISSVFSQKDTAEKVSIVGPKEVIDGIEKDFKKDKLEFVLNNGKTDYCSQINLGVKNCKSKYFSILEFDDKYSPTWFKNVNKYVSNKPEFSMFFPIVNFTDKEDNIVGTSNEIIWAMSFSNEIGVIDEEILQSYYDFSICGGVFRTDDFIEVGMLKPSIKLSFWYEFLLRATSKNLKAFVIPKNGCYHLIEREDSLINQYKDMDAKERAWWIKLASKEFYYEKERKASYKYTPSKELAEVDGLK
jgi:hypothetical protein